MAWEYIGKPKEGRQCEIKLTDGTVVDAVWVERINKYTGCHRWRRTESNLTKKEKWIDSKNVIEWRYK